LSDRNSVLIYLGTNIVILLERGKGDTVEEIEEYWGNSDIEEIYERVTEWKSEQQ